jgi:phenylalanyl-tRNA synthetase beta chain
MVEALGRNAARQADQAAFFEIGRSYHRGSGDGPQEVERLAIGLMGAVGHFQTVQQGPTTPGDVYLWAKGIWEALTQTQGAPPWSIAPLQVPALEDGMSISIQAQGRTVGLLGVVKRSLCAKWRIAEPLAVIETQLQAVLPADDSPPTACPVPAYPAITRDVSLLLEEHTTHQQVMDVVKKVSPKELETVRLFDIFAGEGISAGKKSLAYSFRYRSAERTLTDEEANRHHDRIKDALRRDLGAEIRDH